METFEKGPNQKVETCSYEADRSRPEPRSSLRSDHPILHLQRTIGNQAVLRLLRNNTAAAERVLSEHGLSRTIRSPAARAIQTKLAINRPGDEFEQDADRFADQVMRMPEPEVQRQCGCGGTCAECSKQHSEPDHAPVQMKQVSPSDAAEAEAPPSVNAALLSPGQPLDSATRAFMEPRFGHDFSGVRIHTDAAAAESSRDINAHAYTAGQSIVFASGQYAPGTATGNRLIAHELTHVVQQGSVGDRSPTGIGRPGDAYETEADGIRSNGKFSSPDKAMRTAHPVVQRALPVAAEVLEIVLTGVIVGQEFAAANQGKLLVETGTASRRGDPPQPKDRENKAMVLHISRTHHLYPNVHADFYVYWQSNDFGEIGAAYVDVLPDHTQFSRSSLNVEFKPLDNLPNKGQDIRAWPIQWIYTGNFDPIGPGDYDFQGKFEIDAFGGFRVLEHTVNDNSTFLKIGGASADELVEKGDNIPTRIVPLPPGTKVTTQATKTKKP